MKTESETDRLNRIGAEIMGLHLAYRNGKPIYYTEEGVIHNWSPATDLNHNAIVMDTFDSWEVYKMGGYGRQKRIYTCKIWTDIGKWFIGQADTEALARAKAYEKA